MPQGPKLWLVGDVEHCDFRESLALVRRTADVGPGPPELIILAESRPGTIRRCEYERLRRSAPLAAVVSLCGSWCEGELRTGRPLAGAMRLYWYEFPSWWQRQIERHGAGRCPEWAGGEDFGFRIADGGLGGRVAVSTDCWDKFEALADTLQYLNLKSDWVQPWRGLQIKQPIRAGIWDGGQLSDAELGQLATFCERMSSHSAAVVALLDFPRNDRCAFARNAGARAVVGKPWGNADLIVTLRDVMGVNHRAARVA